MNIKKLLSDSVVEKIVSKFDLSNNEANSIIETIANAVKGDKSNMGSKIVSDLKSKENLNEDVAVQIKEMVLPLILEAVSKNSGEQLSGFLGKFKK